MKNKCRHKFSNLKLNHFKLNSNCKFQISNFERGVYPAPLSLIMFNMFFNCKITNRRSFVSRRFGESGAGFTIIELIISIFILSVAIIGVYAAFSVMVILSSEAEDRLVAAYLAQEGVEIIRNIRDSNWIKGRGWDEYIGGCGSGTTGCEVDYKTTGSLENPVYVWVGQGRFLKIDPENSFYNYDVGAETKFTRKITIEPLDVFIVRVKAEVFWNKKPSIISPDGAEDSIAVEETLYDWY